MTDKLLPCPFCGRIAEIATSKDGFTSIGCLHCNPLFGVMVQRRTKAEAIAVWNTRTDGKDEIVRCRDCAYSFDGGSRCRKWRGQDCSENSVPSTWSLTASARGEKGRTMTDDNLLPCPFCGSNALYEIYVHIDSFDTPTMFCDTCKALVTFEGFEDYVTNTRDGMYELRAAWNTRTERTCEFKPFKGPISDLDEDGNRKGVCSECNAYMHEQFCYCPNCGAMVVS